MVTFNPSYLPSIYHTSEISGTSTSETLGTSEALYDKPFASSLGSPHAVCFLLFIVRQGSRLISACFQVLKLLSLSKAVSSPLYPHGCLHLFCFWNRVVF